MKSETTSGNEKKLTQLNESLVRILDEVLERGFHGSAQLVLNVQDGTIQNIRRTVERIER